jgi:membrane dipeptidase
MSFPVFDLHCDTALELLGKDLRSPRSLKKNDLHIDLERAKKLPGYVQCFACFTTPGMDKWFGVSAENVFQLELDIILAELERNKRTMSQIYSVADIHANMEKGKMSAILSIEGPAGFGFDPALLTYLHAVGFRLTTLGWNEDNVLCGSHKTGGGLTSLGREYVKEAQRLGMVVDVSHCSDKAFWDMMEITQKPLIASHSNSRAVCDVSRNLTDEMFMAICQVGGVAGINQYAEFLGDKPDLDTVCRHIEHFLEMDPTGEHIALGGDLDGCERLAEGFEGIQSYPSLAQRLLDRGASLQIVENIYWNNAIGVMEKCFM